MAIINGYLTNVVKKQLDDHGIVVWFDPERYYHAIATALDIPNSAVLIYKGSFFALRSEFESLLDQSDRPRLLAYVPLEPSRTQNALAEVEAYGVTLRPAQQPPVRNTKLSVIAKNALKATNQWTEEDAEKIAKEIEAGKYNSLDEIEQIVQRRGEATGVLQLIFGTGNTHEIALKFLSDQSGDSRIEQKVALPELCRVLNMEFDAGLSVGDSTSEIRHVFANHILLTEFRSVAKSDIPKRSLDTKRDLSEASRKSCCDLARTWRFRRDLRDSYAECAMRLEAELGIRENELMGSGLTQLETFVSVERALQRQVEASLLANAKERPVQIARERQSSFWSQYFPENQARWALIVAAGEVLIQASRLEKEMKSQPKDAASLLNVYTDTENPWYLLDRQYRHLERRYYGFEFVETGSHDQLDQLVTRARQRYMEIGSSVAEVFLRSYQAAKFKVSGVMKQTEIYERKIKSKLQEGRTAYFLVDALRYEMGEELARALREDFEVEILPAIASVPTITEIGMASLLPDAQRSGTILPPDRDQLDAI